MGREWAIFFTSWHRDRLLHILLVITHPLTVLGVHCASINTATYISIQPSDSSLALGLTPCTFKYWCKTFNKSLIQNKWEVHIVEWRYTERETYLYIHVLWSLIPCTCLQKLNSKWPFVLWVAHLYPCPYFPPTYYMYTITTFPYHGHSTVSANLCDWQFFRAILDVCLWKHNTATCGHLYN